MNRFRISKRGYPNASDAHLAKHTRDPDDMPHYASHVPSGKREAAAEDDEEYENALGMAGSRASNGHLPQPTPDSSDAVSSIVVDSGFRF